MKSFSSHLFNGTYFFSNGRILETFLKCFIKLGPCSECCRGRWYNQSLTYPKVKGKCSQPNLVLSDSLKLHSQTCNNELITMMYKSS